MEKKYNKTKGKKKTGSQSSASCEISRNSGIRQTCGVSQARQTRQIHKTSRSPGALRDSGSSEVSGDFPAAKSEFREKQSSSNGEALFADVAVIGAGASGLAAAVAAARRGSSVILAEGNDKAGKKLYATGNGRCNFTNRDCSPRSFNRPEDFFVERVLQKFGTDETLGFFQSEGMMVRLEEGGRCYPYSGQASAVVNTLRRAAEDAGCRFLFSDKAVETSFCADLYDADGKKEDETMGASLLGNDAQCVNGGIDAAAHETGTDSSAPQSGEETGHFCVHLESGKIICCRNLIIACGGRAGLKTGSTGDGYGFARSFGHTLTPPRPALAAAESEELFLTALKGVRVRGKAELWERTAGKVAEEQGEIQFTGTGISGICVFDLTRFMDQLPPPARKKKKRQDREASGERKTESFKEYTIVCDFVPEKDEEELYRILAEQTCHGNKQICDGSKRMCGERETASAESGQAVFRDRRDKKRTLSEALAGIVNERLAGVIAERAKEDVRRAAAMLKHFDVSVSHTRGWEEAQVTCGGVRREELEPGTLQSLLRPGLYFCGEVVDVDGRCGGFNLQWAWSSGAAAGCAAAEKGRKKC